MLDRPSDPQHSEEHSEDSSEPWVLRLYVAGNSPRSQRAVRNLCRICEEHLGDTCQVEVIDIYQERERARAHQVVGAPTLIRELPLPLRRLIGDLSDEDSVVAALDLSHG